ncbi:MAG: class D sortase [Vicinamibacterales bacterium]
MWPDSSPHPLGATSEPEPAIAARLIQVARGVEHVLFLMAFALGLWAVLSAAERQFYASLPVPADGARAAPVTDVLPGDAGTHATAGDAASRSLAPGTWLARLEAPRVGLTATVLEGSTDDILARAAGHIEDTTLPGDIGTSGNIGIAGHRDTTFRPLSNVKVGDVLSLQTSDGTRRYRVNRTLIVEPEDVHVLDPTGRPTLTLVTCYPFTFLGHAPKRFIVQAEAVQE